jgi:hypothetical protein
MSRRDNATTDGIMEMGDIAQMMAEVEFTKTGFLGRGGSTC